LFQQKKPLVTWHTLGAALHVPQNIFVKPSLNKGNIESVIASLTMTSTTPLKFHMTLTTSLNMLLIMEIIFGWDCQTTCTRFIYKYLIFNKCPFSRKPKSCSKREVYCSQRNYFCWNQEKEIHHTKGYATYWQNNSSHKVNILVINNLVIGFIY
jgi:hypothetical protein